MRKLILMILALAWLPLTSHCKVESLPGFDFLRCDLTHAESATDSCEDDVCCAVESADYFSPRFASIVTPGFSCAAPLTDIFTKPTRSTAPDIHDNILNSDPPALPCSWQFSLRAAPSPRAPSSFHN